MSHIHCFLSYKGLHYILFRYFGWNSNVAYTLVRKEFKIFFGHFSENM